MNGKSLNGDYTELEVGLFLCNYSGGKIGREHTVEQKRIVYTEAVLIFTIRLFLYACFTICDLLKVVAVRRDKAHEPSLISLLPLDLTFFCFCTCFHPCLRW